MFMVCAMALVLRTDKAVGQGGGSILQQFSKPAPKTAPAPAKPPVPAPQSNTPPVTQPPAQQQAPASPQPAPAQPKKP
jgi:hypothetical protein